MDNFSSRGFGTQDNTTPRTDFVSPTEYPEFQAAMIIWRVTPPIIFVLGCFGNVATIFIMRHIKEHNSSQHVILMALAVSDLTLLCATSIHAWVWYVFYVDLQVLHVVVCKLIAWATYASGTLSAWLVTCVTVQRTMAVLWPHRMRVMCTVRRTWIVVATLGLTVFFLYFHVLLGMEITQENECYALPGWYKQFFNFIFSWLDTCLASIIPSICLFVCDIILSVTLFKAVSSSSKAVRMDSNVSTVQNADSRRKTSYRTTVMVLAISCAFLALAMPVCVFLIWLPYVDKDTLQRPEMTAKVQLLYSVTHQLWCTNSAINFFLYCLTGTKFRREFLAWFRRVG